MTNNINLNLIKKYWLNTPELFSEKYNTTPIQLLSPVNWFLLSRRKKALQMCGEVKDKKILDVGCGSAVFLIEFIKRGATVVGIDYSQKMLNLAERELKAHKIPEKSYRLKRADATKIPFKNREFDLVLATGLADYLTDQQNQKFLKEAARVLNKNGKIIVSFPMAKSPFAFLRVGIGLKIRQRFFKLPPIHNRFSAQKIKKFLKEANLKENYKCSIFNAMWLVEASHK